MSDGDLIKAARAAGLEAELAEALTEADAKPRPRANLRFYLAILGVLPWVGVLISAAIARWAEADQDRTNELHRSWLEEHQRRFDDLERTVMRMRDDIGKAGPAAERRLRDESFLSLVRKGFRVWDRSETEEKRELIRRVLTNAACDSHCTDDFVRRFIEWIDYYSEAHLAVIKVLYQQPHSTREDIWEAIHGAQVREDSAEADLFKLLIRDLSTGSVIRQYRPTDLGGNFIKKTPRRAGARTMKSAFDDQEPYVLTSLGQDFVHYVLNEVVRKLGAGNDEPGPG